MKESILVGFFCSKKEQLSQASISSVKVKSICSDGFFLKNGIIHTFTWKRANKKIIYFLG
jgi:hypothetical protein